MGADDLQEKRKTMNYLKTWLVREEEDDELSEILARKMDNSVKKMMLTQGTGEPVPQVA